MCRSKLGVTAMCAVARVILCLQLPSDAQTPTVRVAEWCGEWGKNKIKNREAIWCSPVERISLTFGAGALHRGMLGLKEHSPWAKGGFFFFLLWVRVTHPITSAGAAAVKTTQEKYARQEKRVHILACHMHALVYTHRDTAGGSYRRAFAAKFAPLCLSCCRIHEYHQRALICA